MKSSAFGSYHPIVTFLYFVLVLAYTMVIMHPLCLGISLFCAVFYVFLLKGREALRRGILLFLPMMLAAALLNSAFNHRGVTILEYLPSGNPLTLEAILYGVAAAVMLAAVLCWFSCYNVVMTSDKFVYLFGRVAPVLSLLLTMVLRFVPKLGAQMKIISNAQRCIGRNMRSGSAWQRVQCGVRILSILVTWSLENAIETADSMNSRGYGLPGRTAFSIYHFDGRDGKLLCGILGAGAYLLMGTMTGGVKWRYFPSVKLGTVTLYSASVFLIYFLLCATPIIIQSLEGRKWTVSRLST